MVFIKNVPQHNLWEIYLTLEYNSNQVIDNSNIDKLMLINTHNIKSHILKCHQPLTQFKYYKAKKKQEYW